MKRRRVRYAEFMVQVVIFSVLLAVSSVWAGEGCGDEVHQASDAHLSTEMPERLRKSSTTNGAFQETSLRPQHGGSWDTSAGDFGGGGAGNEPI